MVERGAVNSGGVRSTRTSAAKFEKKMCTELVPYGYNPEDCCISCHSDMEYADQYEGYNYPYDPMIYIPKDPNAKVIKVYAPCCGSKTWMQVHGTARYID